MTYNVFSGTLNPTHLPEEIKKDRKKPQGKNIMSASATHGRHNHVSI